ncbi:hypothetical protein MKX01_026625 [Papaver californicum]|nr:hypothetical protein MKX01_026625 [Papaver californicum]
MGSSVVFLCLVIFMYGSDYVSWEPSSGIEYVTFTLNGATYKLNAIDGNNTKFMVRGAKGFGNLLWKVQSHRPDVKSPCITFTYDSFDGEQGFPWKVPVSVTYMIMGSNKLLVRMKAKAINKAAPGQIFASHITPTDSGLVPTGKISPVKCTPFVFLTPQTIGSKLKILPGGFDINYALDGATNSKKLKKTAVVSESKPGGTMWSNQPGVQFYTAITLANMLLITLIFSSVIVNPSQTYSHLMLFRFTTKNVQKMHVMIILLHRYRTM